MHENATKLFTTITAASDAGALFITMHQMLSVQSINCDLVNGARSAWQGVERAGKVIRVKEEMVSRVMNS